MAKTIIAIYTYSPATATRDRDTVKTPAQATVSTGNNLTDNAVHKGLLHPRNLPLERINLLPAVQRSTIMQPQATNNISLGPCNTLVQFSQLPPPIKPAAQLFNLAHHRVRRDIPVDNGLRRFLRRGEDGRGLVFPAREGDSRRIEVQ